MYISAVLSNLCVQNILIINYITNNNIFNHRYEEKLKQENKSQYSMQNEIISLVHPNEAKLNFEFESTITNSNLYSLLLCTDRKKICLLDTRPSDVFHKFKITSCDVINIPKENLIPGYEL